MQSEMRIALDVRLYEEVLFELHLTYALWVDKYGIPAEGNGMQRLIRRLEVNAYEVTWKRPNPPRRSWYGRQVGTPYEWEGR